MNNFNNFSINNNIGMNTPAPNIGMNFQQMGMRSPNNQHQPNIGINNIGQMNKFITRNGTVMPPPPPPPPAMNKKN